MNAFCVSERAKVVLPEEACEENRSAASALDFVVRVRPVRREEM